MAGHSVIKVTKTKTIMIVMMMMLIIMMIIIIIMVMTKITRWTIRELKKKKGKRNTVSHQGQDQESSITHGKYSPFFSVEASDWKGRELRLLSRRNTEIEYSLSSSYISFLWKIVFTTKQSKDC